MNKTKIEWCDYTWNPITGCLHGCDYCYARKIAMRFDGHFNPTFHENRLNDKMPKKPSKIFVGSMADMFGNWVPSEWIFKIFEVIKKNPQHEFMFLTKNPNNYWDYYYKFPVNIWLGTTINTMQDIERLDKLTEVNVYRTFVSIEPLLDNFSLINFSEFKLVIVGGMTGPKAIKPKQEWIDSIKHHNIFYKKNLEMEDTKNGFRLI